MHCLQERLAKRLSSLLSSDGVSNDTQALWMQYMVFMDSGLAALVSKVKHRACHILTLPQIYVLLRSKTEEKLMH